MSENGIDIGEKALKNNFCGKEQFLRGEQK